MAKSFIAVLLFAMVAAVACTTGSTAEGPVNITLPTPIPATPTPVPTPTPTPSPGPLTVQSGSGAPSSSISLSFTTAGAVQSFTAGDPGFTSAFTIGNTCGGIANLAPGSGSGPSLGFNLTSVAAGTCAVTIGDGLGHTASVSVTVTTTTGTIQGKGKGQ